MTQDTRDTFSRFCQQLTDRCQAILSKKLSAKEDDHLGFMLATFAPRQVDHLHGVGYLLKGECYAQAGILARAMLEGFALLYWAKDDVDRARRWRAYSLVHDLRLLRQKQTAGEEIAPDHEEELLGRLRSDAQVFLKSGPKKNVTDHVLGNPDSYRRVWTVDSDGDHLTISAIIEGLDADLKRLYSHFSRNVHWDIVGMAPYLSRASSGYEIATRQPGDALQAMAMGFQACVQTFLLHAVQFELPEELTALDVLKNDYVAALQGRAPSA